jgi:hypothetical protein
MGGKQEAVVLVHGLYMHGIFMSLLARRLRRNGYRTIIFSYPSMRRTPVENVRKLLALSSCIDTPKLHFLGHSLGGLLLRHLLASPVELAPGRVVTLGTPHGGSYLARALSDRGFGALVGRSAEGGLLGDVPPWHGQRQLGSLAGSRCLGLGRLVRPCLRPSDGAVTVSETCLSGMTDHVVLPVSHSGMIFSRSVAEQALCFLASGRFQHVQ